MIFVQNSSSKRSWSKNRPATTVHHGHPAKTPITQPLGFQALRTLLGQAPSKGGDWIGGGLRVSAGGKHKGPVYGEHDSHWYVQRGSDRLHVVDGYAWHAGLPLEQTLARSGSISVRGWVFEGIVGLDLSGHTNEGKYWRWVGAPVADA